MTDFSPELQTALDNLAHGIAHTGQQVTDNINRIKEQGQTLELTHNKLELSDARLAGVERSIALLSLALDELRETPAEHDRIELYTALAKAQEEITNADKNVDNEFTKKKYADLASTMDAVREPLAKNGLVIIQVNATRKEILDYDDLSSAIGMKTTMAHISGQTIVDITTMSPPKLDPQGIGSCRTYIRRYAVLAMCGIAGAADDDAEGTKLDPNDYERISAEEVDQIIMKADELFEDRADNALKQMVQKTFNLMHITDIKAGEAELAITRLSNAAAAEKKAAKKGAKAKPSPKPPVTTAGKGKDEPGASVPEPEGREPGSDDDKE